MEQLIVGSGYSLCTTRAIRAYDTKYKSSLDNLDFSSNE
jgi:hypothetical protein